MAKAAKSRKTGKAAEASTAAAAEAAVEGAPLAAADAAPASTEARRNGTSNGSNNAEPASLADSDPTPFEKRMRLQGSMPARLRAAADAGALQAVPFLTADAAHSGEWLEAAAWLFKMVKTFEPFEMAPLAELYTDGFDLEQIWEQVRLLNEKLVPYVEEMAAEFPSLDGEEAEDSASDAGSLVEDEDGDDDDGDDEDDVEDDEDGDLEPGDDEDGDMELGDDANDNGEGEFEMDMPSEKESKPIKRRRTVVDDEFFSLAEMERFADLGERHDMKEARKANRNSKEADADDDNDAEDDMFSFDADLLEGDLEGDEDEDDENGDNANDIRYEDFFEPSPKNHNGSRPQRARPSWQEREGADDDESADMAARGEAEDSIGEADVDFGDLADEVDDGETGAKSKSLFDDDEDAEVQMHGQTLSTFEKQQARINKTIEELEREALQAKPWTLKGEVSSKARPLNSLLEEDLEIEHAAKPVPVVTEESTATLESLIIQRIKDQAWDDVVRKAPPKDTVYDPNRKFELMDEKSTRSLAQVYEDEFLRQKNKSAPTEKDLALQKQHDEITTLFKNLCQDLDALANWHYTPGAATLEVEVVPAASVPAIQMEEVTPATVSEAMLAAPHEVHSATVGKSQAEMDAADKRRARIKAKRQVARERKQREQARQAREAATGVTSAQATKDKAMKQLMGQKNVTIIADKQTTKQMDGARASGKRKRDVSAKVVQAGDKVGTKTGHGERAENLRL